MNERRWSPTIATLGDQIAALTVAQAVELGEYLDKVHGVQMVSAPVVTPDHIVDPRPTPPPPPTEFDVQMDGYDPARKVAVIKAVRELTGLGLKESKDLVEAAPCIVREKLPKEEAEKVKAKLEAAGATVSLR